MLIRSSVTYHAITDNLITARNACTRRSENHMSESFLLRSRMFTWAGIRHVVSFRSVLYHLSWKQMCDRSSDRDVDHSRNFVGFSHYVITDANRIVDHIRFWKIRGRNHEITICVWKKTNVSGTMSTSLLLTNVTQSFLHSILLDTLSRTIICLPCCHNLTWREEGFTTV